MWCCVRVHKVQGGEGSFCGGHVCVGRGCIHRAAYPLAHECRVGSAVQAAEQSSACKLRNFWHIHLVLRVCFRRDVSACIYAWMRLNACMHGPWAHADDQPLLFIIQPPVRHYRLLGCFLGCLGISYRCLFPGCGKVVPAVMRWTAPLSWICPSGERIIYCCEG